METTLELPNALFREAKSLAARNGLSFRQLTTEALAEKLRMEKHHDQAKPWLHAFDGLERDAGLTAELRRISKLVEEEFEHIDPGEWK